MQTYEEWFTQSFYDLETADALFHAERFIHAVFMAHLAVEKALKGTYFFRNNALPPKTHDLIYLVERTELNLSQDYWNLIYLLRDTNLLTRYPTELEQVILKYNKKVVRSILDNAEEFIIWTKNQL